MTKESIQYCCVLLWSNQQGLLLGEEGGKFPPLTAQLPSPPPPKVCQ